MIEFYDNDNRRKYGTIIGRSKSGETVFIKDYNGHRHQIKPSQLIERKEK